MAVVAFIVGVVFSLGASALLVTRLERLAAQFGAARGKTVALWYGGLTLVASGLALRGGGLDRREGGLIVGLYLAFVALLIVSQRFLGSTPAQAPAYSAGRRSDQAQELRPLERNGHQTLERRSGLESAGYPWLDVLWLRQT